jgi:hypothetical protein
VYLALVYSSTPRVGALILIDGPLAVIANPVAAISNSPRRLAHEATAGNAIKNQVCAAR